MATDVAMDGYDVSSGRGPGPGTGVAGLVARGRSRVVLAGDSPPLARRESRPSLPNISLTRRQSSRSMVPVPLSTILETQNSTLRKDWIATSPRKIQFEKTMIKMESNLSGPLQDFFEQVANIPEKKMESVRSKTNTFLEYLMPRLVKLAYQEGMKISGYLLAGSSFDKTQVVNNHNIDIFLLFEREKSKLDSLEGGYHVIPLRRYRERPGHPPDQFRYGRSDSGLFLSSLRTAQVLHALVERSLRLNVSVTLDPFTSESNRSQIAVRWKKYTFHLIAANFLPNEECYLVTQPYAHDSRPGHELAWRLSYVRKERKILAMMDKADRGARTKAFRILKALVKVEPTLSGLTSYHIKTVLLHSFDTTVDQTPRWQRDPTETAFMCLLRLLDRHLNMGSLPNFFVRSLDLFKNMDPRRLASVRSRVAYLLANENELIRVLKKRKTVKRIDNSLPS